MTSRAIATPFRLLNVCLLLTAASQLIQQRCHAGGVTVITHGLNGNVDGWITGMANEIPKHPRAFGTNFTCYEMYFVNMGGSYFLTAARVAGDPPNQPPSGEIVVKLDWRQLADGDSYDTYQVAAAVVPALLSTNFIPELGGRALAEFPLHLTGHSRGGSLVCEMSRLLGTNGVWVDHLTTLDPHPLNDPEFPLDRFAYSDVDAPALTYANVLFHDNYWQEIYFFASGKAVSGAYVRQLTSLDGGYSGLAPEHSNVHLWYHGTINTNTPSSDTEASIASSQRTSWWSAYEARGQRGGFHYGLIGGGDRLSADQPLGSGTPAIREGVNQWWDFGAGLAGNRTALTSNNGNWPNLIRFNRMTTNQVLQGQSTPTRSIYQWAQPDFEVATISIHLDEDLNPLNTNQTLLQEIIVPGTGASFVGVTLTNITLAASNATPGRHALLATISANGRTRHLYAPEFVEVIALAQPPALGIALMSGTQFRIGVAGAAGQTLVLHYSTNLQDWLPLATNMLAGTNLWLYTNAPPASPAQSYYRAELLQ